MPQLLFVYGTLRPSVKHPSVMQFVSRFKLLGRGSINARLIDLGEYTGAVLATSVDQQVFGELVEVPDDEVLWQDLDHYEGCVPGNEQASLFLRQRFPVNLSDGQFIEAWIYLYNQPINE